MRKSRNIIFALILLGVLAGAYIYMNVRPQETEAPRTDTQTSIQLSNVSRDKITKMVLTSSSGEIIFEKKENQWIWAEDESIQLNQTSVGDIASSFAVLFPERLVEEQPEDLEKYGLQTPAVTARAILDDGEEIVFYVGNKSAAGNTYYLMAKDDPAVYLVWMNHGNNFSRTIADVRLKTLPQINGQEIQYFLLEREGKPTIEIGLNEAEDDGKAYGLGIWVMKQPYAHVRTISTEDFGAVLEQLPTFSIKGFVEDEAADLAQYGLDEPKMEFVLQDKENTLHLLIGENKDEQTVYFKTADNNDIFTMDAKALDVFNITPFKLIDKFAYITYIDGVDRIDIEAPGRSQTMILTRTTKKAEKEGEEDEVVTTYTVDGKEVEEKPFKTYYQSLIGIIIDAELDRTMEEAPADVTTTFKLSTGQEVKISYVPYNPDFYAVFRDGSAEFVVSRKKVNDMLNTLDDLMMGNLPKE